MFNPYQPEPGHRLDSLWTIDEPETFDIKPSLFVRLKILTNILINERDTE